LPPSSRNAWAKTLKHLSDSRVGEPSPVGDPQLGLVAVFVAAPDDEVLADRLADLGTDREEPFGGPLPRTSTAALAFSSTSSTPDTERLTNPRTGVEQEDDEGSVPAVVEPLPLSGSKKLPQLIIGDDRNHLLLGWGRPESRHWRLFEIALFYKKAKELLQRLEPGPCG